MLAWRIPRWVLQAALGGVLAIAVTDAVLMWRHPIAVRPQAIPEKIRLHADAEGEGLRVQWDRVSRPIRNADHARLYIRDGPLQSQLELTGRQLDTSTVMYWPESERVTFRLEVYCGTQNSSDSATFGMPENRNVRRHAGPARATVEQARPSPFEHVAPEIVVTQTRPAPLLEPEAAAPEAVPPDATAPQAVAGAEPAREGRLGRMISKIPLLRRLREHPPADETQPR